MYGRERSSNNYLGMLARQAIDVIADFLKIADRSWDQPGRFAVIKMNLRSPMVASIAAFSLVDLLHNPGQILPKKVSAVASPQSFIRKILD